jgi:hypothetical protein
VGDVWVDEVDKVHFAVRWKVTGIDQLSLIRSRQNWW